MMGRGSGTPSSKSGTTTVLFLPYHVRFVLVLTAPFSLSSSPFSKSAARSSVLIPCTPRGVLGGGSMEFTREPFTFERRAFRLVIEPWPDWEPGPPLFSAVCHERGLEDSPFTLAGCELALVVWLAAFGLDLHKSLMRRSSKSRHVGIIVSMESDHTIRTRSSRYKRTYY